MSRIGAVAVVVVLAVAFGVTAGALPAQSTDSPPEGEGVPAPPAGEADGAETLGDGSEPENPVSRSAAERVLAGVAVVGLAVAFVLAPGYRRSVAGGAVTLAVAAASYAWVRPDPDGVVALASTTATDVAAPAGALAAIAVTVGIGVFAWRARRDGDHTTGDSEGVRDADASAGSGSSGAVGQHPAAVDASTDVGQAWQRAVREVEVSAPAARTPGEFVRAGAETVVDAAAFERLTALFRRVRYGDADPDDAASTAASLAAAATGEEAHESERANGNERAHESERAHGNERGRHGESRGGEA